MGIRSGEPFIRAIEGTQPAFDVAILGWKLSDMDAGDVLAELRRRELAAQVVVFSNDHFEAMRAARRAGLLLPVRRSVHPGRYSACGPQWPHLHSLYICWQDQRDAADAARTRTARCLADGWTNLQIATRTGISGNTVKYHLKNFYDKVCVTAPWRPRSTPVSATEARNRARDKPIFKVAQEVPDDASMATPWST